MAFSSTIHDNGKKIALSGDEATCGNCKGAFKIFGTGKGMSEKGRDVVVDGDLVLCPCKKNRVIIGSNPGVFLEIEGGSGASNVRSSAATPTPSSRPLYDEQFRLVDFDTGRVLAGIRYRITAASGRVLTGTTNATGYTERIATDGSDKLRIEVQTDDSIE